METVDYLKGYGLPLNKNIDDGVQDGEFKRDEKCAFGEEIPGNPGNTPVTSSGTRSASPVGINIVG